ncbi:MAG: M48 family metallopeptidase [Clostridia bacterium]|nr:M48 family metallopeptidase [Clostridia bacterium]
MEYKKIESRRKTVSIHVTVDGALVVRCPIGFSDNRIKDLIEKNRGKIEDAIKKAQSVDKPEVMKGKPPEVLYFLGESYTIMPMPGRRVAMQDHAFIVPQGAENHFIEIFLKEEAKRYLTEKTKEWAQRVGKSPTNIKITSAARRWGSASTKNHICYPWRLMLLPPHLIDYVVVHELSHLWEHNHSAAFYQRLESILPDYKEREKEIRDWEQKLQREGWYHAF